MNRGALLDPPATHGRALRPPDFRRLAEHIREVCGIHLPPAKQTMLETRLQRRVRELGLSSLAEYCDLILGDKAPPGELVLMLDLVTTNKTDFFREPHHFQFLTRVALPELMDGEAAGRRRALRVWSAGCSTGEEPYTLAMVLAAHADARNPLRFKIIATDLSTRVLQAAAAGIYDEERVRPVPEGWRRRFLMRSRDPARNQVRVVPELRELVEFRRLNLLGSDYGLGDPMDVVFCRNVLIYFDRKTQELVLQRIARCMASPSYLFTGHSETLVGLDVPFSSVAPTIYRPCP